MAIAEREIQTDGRPPRDDLYRAVYLAEGAEVRGADAENPLPVLFGHFAVFDEWAEVDSVYEGHFLERVAPGATLKTIAENRSAMKVMFHHGMDPTLGKQLLGTIRELREDDVGPYYEVDLFDGIPPLLLAGLRAGEYGVSYRFSIINDHFVQRPPASEHNPQGLPERTVLEMRVKEFGPTPMPVQDKATAGVRSLTDDVFVERLRHDPAKAAAFGVRVDGFGNGAEGNTAAAGFGSYTLNDIVSVSLAEVPTRVETEERQYKRAWEYVTETPWAIHPAALQTIIGILEERRAGGRPSPAEIAERIGTRADVPADGHPPDGPVRVINVMAPIVPHGAAVQETSSGPLVGIDGLRAEFRAAVESADVKGILLRFDTPGGSVEGVPELNAEILAARGKKPIWAHADGWAASAGYYLASAADEISVNPSGKVGSIGVYAAHQDLSAQMEQKGIKTTIVKAGKYKAEANPVQPLSEEAQAHMQSQVDAFYEMFVKAVAKGRGVPVEDVRAGFGEGRMVMAAKAVTQGMADRVSTFDQALARMEKAVADTTRSEDDPEDRDALLATYFEEACIDTVTPAVMTNAQLSRSIKWNREERERSATSEVPPLALRVSTEEEPERSDATTPPEPEPPEATTPSDGDHDEDQQGATEMLVEERRARISEILSRRTDLHEAAGGDALDAEAQEEWDGLSEELRMHERAVENHAMRTRQIAESVRRTEGEGEPYDRTGNGDGYARDVQIVRQRRRVPDDPFDLGGYRAMADGVDTLYEGYREGARRIVEAESFAHPDADRSSSQERLEWLLANRDGKNSEGEEGVISRRIIATCSPTYKRAFGKKITGKELTPDEQRAMSLTTTAGGFAVPVTLDPTLILTSNGVVNPLRQVSRVETITGNTWQGLTSAGITAAYTAEATETTDANPVFAQPVANVEKAQALIPFSIEIGQDYGQMQSEMARLFQDAKDTVEADKFLTGVGHASNVPEGFLVGGTVVVTTAAATTLARGDLYGLEEALPPRYRPRAVILGNKKQFNRVRQFDTAGGSDLWVQLGEGMPRSLLGYPNYEYSNMTNALTSGASIFTFGDFTQFLIVDRVGLDVELIPHLFGGSNRFPTGQRALYAYWRNTSKVLTNKALVTLKVT